MKFIAKKGAPDIPLALLEAQEQGTLVLFCGAGISYPAGLPGFKDLVRGIYADLPAEFEPLEKIAFRQKSFDRVLELLERRHSRGENQHSPMRKSLTKLLKIQEGADLETHKSILEISRMRTGQHRLVTTNFDRGFLCADPRTLAYTHVADRLPVPKPHKWNSIVYLHGILDSENDPGNDQLVLTSGNFGSAYLTERWASKFVTELFANYSVLFVGYSIDDPVMRYMTDAIAADRRLGHNRTYKPFALARTIPSRYEVDKKAWIAKGVEPILYHSDRKHRYLHRTLKGWAAYCRDGLGAKERIIRTKALTPPLPPYETDETVNQILDILKEKEDQQSPVSGYAAGVFASLEDPPAPIEWLPVLEENGLLSRAEASGKAQPVHGHHEQGLYASPNEISHHLWGWLCRHLESRELVHWVIDRGSCLHPAFARAVLQVIIGASPIRSPPSPYHEFWYGLCTEVIGCQGENNPLGFDSFIKAMSAPKASSEFVAQLVQVWLNPKIRVSKFFDRFSIDDGKINSRVTAPYSVELAIRLEDWMYDKKLTKLSVYPEVFVPILATLTTNLLSGLSLLKLYSKALYDEHDKVDRISDHSHIDIPSIEPHPQSHHLQTQTWTLLVKICWDVWLEAWDSQPDIATSVFRLWRAQEYSVFRRLTLLAATERPILSPSEAVEMLLEDNAWWLWSAETQREKFKLLATHSAQIEPEIARRLEEAILAGPPRGMFQEDLSGDEWEQLVDREAWLHLSKLQSFGNQLSADAVTRLDTLQERYPGWALTDDDRNESATWLESPHGITPETLMLHSQLAQLPVEGRVEFLADQSGEFHEEKIGSFKSLATKQGELVIETLRYLADTENWHPEIWAAGLVGLADNTEIDSSEFLSVLLRADDALLQEKAWAMAHWIDAISPRLKSPDIESDYSDVESDYWLLFDRLLSASPTYPGLVERTDQIIIAAINHPVGILTKSFLSRLAARKLSKNDGLREPEVLARLEALLSHQKAHGFLASVILISRLSYFHFVDPDWCKRSLIPLLDWSTSEYPNFYWAGFLWVLRGLSIDLAASIASALIDSLKRLEKLDDQSSTAADLFGVICLEYPDIYTDRQVLSAMRSIGVKGYSDIARLIWRSLETDRPEQSREGRDGEGTGVSKADGYWSGRVVPFIKRRWPKDDSFISKQRSKQSSQSLALAVLELTSEFASGVDLIGSFLGPATEPHIIIKKALERPQLARDNPGELLRLLGLVFSDRRTFLNQEFRDMFSTISEHDPTLKDTPDYKKIDYFLRKNRI